MNYIKQLQEKTELYKAQVNKLERENHHLRATNQALSIELDGLRTKAIESNTKERNQKLQVQELKSKIEAIQDDMLSKIREIGERDVEITNLGKVIKNQTSHISELQKKPKRKLFGFINY